MENKNLLLACALELFCGRGYDAVGTQEICEQAGVTKPTLYHYFHSKRGLLDALLSQSFSLLLEPLVQATAYSGDITLSVERVIRTYFDFASSHLPFYRLQLAMNFAPPESEPHQAVLPFYKAQYHLLEALFKQAEADHGNMRHRSSAYAITLLGMINAYISLVDEFSSSADDDLVYRVGHQFMHGIFS